MVVRQHPRHTRHAPGQPRFIAQLPDYGAAGIKVPAPVPSNTYITNAVINPAEAAVCGGKGQCPGQRPSQVRFCRVGLVAYRQ